MAPVGEVEPADSSLSQYAPQHATTQIESSLSPNNLRGETGLVDLEGYAAIIVGAPDKNILQRVLPFMYDERDFVSFGEVKKFFMVKNGTCFVYNDKSDPSPLYAFSMETVHAILEDPKKPDKGGVTISPIPNTNLPRESMVTVLLKHRSNRKQAFQFTFDTDSVDRATPKRFMDLVELSKLRPGVVSKKKIVA